MKKQPRSTIFLSFLRILIKESITFSGDFEITGREAKPTKKVLREEKNGTSTIDIRILEVWNPTNILSMNIPNEVNSSVSTFIEIRVSKKEV